MLLTITTSLITLAATLGPFALDPPTVTNQSDGGPQLVITHLSGEVERRSLSGLMIPRWTPELGALLHFEGLESAATAKAESPDGVVLQLLDGQSVRGRITGAESESLSIELLPGAIAQVSIEEIVSIGYPDRIPSGGKVVVEAPETGDCLFIRRGRGIDRVDGLLVEFQSKGVLFEGRLGEKSYLWSDVAALFIEALDEAEAETAEGGTSIVVDLVGGSRLRGNYVGMTDRGLAFRRHGGASLQLPPHSIQSVMRDDGSFRFLSDIPVSDGGPISPHGDELGMVWPHRIDRAVDGGALRAGGRSWSRGIGVHAPSRLTWSLDGSWKEFRASVAIDDSVLSLGASGSVVFRVLVDGEERYRSGIVHGGNAAQRVPTIDLSKASELVLEVQDGEDLWIADRADWLLPILIPAKAASAK